MRHVSFIHQQIFVLLCAMLLTIGCTHNPATASEDIVGMPPAESQDVLIREARREADSLRSELAAVKISAAKQQAQLRTAIDRAKNLQAREESLASSMQEVQASLIAIESERDRLRQENVTLQAQSASLPGIQQLQANVQMIQDSVHHISATMESLMSEVVHIKQDMRKSRHKANSRPANLTAFSMTTPSPALTNADTWLVKSGDTLWRISNERDVSIDELMELNQLDSNLIVEGQTLRIPGIASQATDTPTTPDEAQPTKAAPKNNKDS